MKSNRLWKRIVALVLCIAMVSGDTVITGAGELEASGVSTKVTETTETTDSTEPAEVADTVDVDSTEDTADVEAGDETTDTVDDVEDTAENENNTDNAEVPVIEIVEDVEETEKAEGAEDADETENAEGAENAEETENAENAETVEVVSEVADTVEQETAEAKVRFDYKSDLVNVIVTLNDEKDLPENAELVVTPLEVTAEMENTINEASIEANVSTNSISAFDIKFVVDGVEVEPGATVKVQITLPEVVAGDSASVYHYNEATDVAEDMQAEVAADGTVEFDTTHFSTYIIVNEGSGTVTVTIQHVDSATNTKIYADDVRQLAVGTRINDYKKANNWMVEKVVCVDDEGKETEISEEIQVTSDTTIKVYYTAAQSTVDGEVTFYDYLVKPESGASGSFNDASNYDANSDKNHRLIAGCKSQNYEENRYDANITVNGKTKNANLYQSGENGLVTGLVSGLTEDYSDVNFNLYEPGFFSLDEKTGKTIIDDYKLQFKRTGDTYELSTVINNNNEEVASAGDGFFPLDNAASNKKDYGYNSAHNYYFGMRYDIKFTLGDYVGPLNYSFTGDDDLWVILDGKQVVIDLGGIHDALSEEIDLWTVLELENGKDAMTEEEKNQEHCLTILYMERGGNKSNCQMEFTIPSAEIVSVTNTATSVTLHKVDKDGQPLAGASFKLINDTTGNEATATSLSDGTVTFRNLKVGTYTLKETAAPDGYTATTSTWKVKVTQEEEDSIVAKVYNSNRTELEGNKIVNLKTEDVLEYNKTATLVDWDERTYDITLTADSVAKYTIPGSTTVIETKPVVDVVLVLDISNSMSGTKLKDLKSAATNFVTDLFENADENSTIAIVTFNARAYILQDIVTLKNADAGTINKSINDMSTSKGTNHALALEKAKNILTSNTLSGDRAKYTILFTDGEPTNVGATTDRYKKVDNIMADATGYANDIKGMDNSKIYTIQLGTLASKYETWLEGLSSGAGYSYNTNASIDLSNIFATIREEITTPSTTETVALSNATIVDVVDERFELTDGEKERLEADGATVTVNADGTTTITWTNQTINPVAAADGTASGWSKVIHIVAKEDYIGGNAVETNVNPGSYIEVGGVTVEFPQPKVNVKIEFELSDAEDTIFLGETLEAYFTAEKADEMLGNLEQMKTYEDSEISMTWFDEDGNEVSADDIRNAAPEDDTKYTLKVVVTPEVASDSDEAQAAAKSMMNSDEKVYVAETCEDEAEYTITVVTGSITITKKINQKSYNEKDGDPIFTYKVTNLLDGKVYYRTVRFDVNEDDSYVGTDMTTEENHLFSADYYVCSAQITDLPQGLYKVEELDTMGFSLDKVGTDTKNTNCLYLDESSDAVYAIGYDLASGKTMDDVLEAENYSGLISGPEDEHRTHKDASVIFVNKKVRTPGKETDTDVVKNSLVIDEIYSGNYDADNMSNNE